ncbi:MAG: NUDIX domain-containing protein [Chloroflexi bacterium]|nr:NUDIX domain-containing protein [Chloroflexota bacterium]
MVALAARLRERIQGSLTSALRPLALCILRRGDEILVFEATDPTKHQTFYRPLGGGIEFGERGEVAVVRELREEIGADITQVSYRATLENIFVYDGQRGHEVVLLYEAEFADRSLYACEQFDVMENGAIAVKAMWKSLRFFRERRAPLYPDGLLDLLSTHSPRKH